MCLPNTVATLAPKGIRLILPVGLRRLTDWRRSLYLLHLPRRPRCPQYQAPKSLRYRHRLCPLLRHTLWLEVFNTSSPRHYPPSAFPWCVSCPSPSIRPSLAPRAPIAGCLLKRQSPLSTTWHDVHVEWHVTSCTTDLSVSCNRLWQTLVPPRPLWWWKPGVSAQLTPHGRGTSLVAMDFFFIIGR